MRTSPKFVRLCSFARRRGVGVRFVDHDDTVTRHTKNTLAYYDIPRRQIFLSDILKHARTDHLLYILAHEIGHALDFMSMGRRQKSFQTKVAMFAGYYMKARPRVARDLLIAVRKEVLEGENVAFDIGEEVLKHLSIRIPRRLMAEARDEVIAAYSREFRIPRRKRRRS